MLPALPLPPGISFAVAGCQGVCSGAGAARADRCHLKFWLDIEHFARYQCCLLMSVWSVGICLATATLSETAG
jgi:hypothetical protein